MTWDEDAQIRGIHPIVALRDFILDEKNALYQRTLIVSHLEDDKEHVSRPDFDFEEGQIADSDLVEIVAQLGDRLLSKVLEMTRMLRPDTSPISEWTRDWARFWDADIVSGDLVAATSLLVTLLPNLEKLRLVESFRHYDTGPFYAILDSLLEATEDPDRDLTGLNSFKNLSEVGVHGCDEYSGVDIHISRKFGALPSIRTIKGRRIDGEGGRDGGFFHSGPPTEPASDITTVEFYQSSIDTASFYRCIEKIKSLRKFTYDFWKHANPEPQDWEPRGIIGVLQLFASRTLIHLELTGKPKIYMVNFGRGEPFIGSLRAFEVLETLRLQAVMLYKEVEGTDEETTDDETTDDETPDSQCGTSITADDWPRGPNALVEPERLVDILPASAKRLRLVGELSNEEAMAMLEDVVELKDKRIPNLRRIFFEDVYPASEISSTCEEARVKARFCARV